GRGRARGGEPGLGAPAGRRRRRAAGGPAARPDGLVDRGAALGCAGRGPSKHPGGGWPAGARRRGARWVDRPARGGRGPLLPLGLTGAGAPHHRLRHLRATTTVVPVSSTTAPAVPPGAPDRHPTAAPGRTGPGSRDRTRAVLVAN